MDKEVELLSRVAANHLFLGQFEALRASLLSLRSRDPEVALAILRTIVSEGGSFDGVLWSDACPSPSHLAWLSVLELPEFGNLIRRLDVEILRLKVEFMLLLQEVYSKVLEGQESDSEKKEIELDQSSSAANCLKVIMEFGLRRLKSNADDSNNDDSPPKLVNSMSFREALNGLKDVFLVHADIFDALCWNIHKQLRWLEPSESKLAITVNDVKKGNGSLTAEEADSMVQLQISVQIAHLTALKECSDAGDLNRAISFVRYLHLDFGLDKSEYQMALQGLIKNICGHNNGFRESRHFFHKAILMVYAEALSSNHVQFTQMIQSIQDENLSDEIEKNMVSGGTFTPLPLQKYLEALNLGRTAVFDGQSHQNFLQKICTRELYHFARISGSHVLECVMNYALSAVKREQLQEASDALSLFPLLQPLVAVMGWDLLSSKTLIRRKLMKILWTSKSQTLRLEEHSVYGKQSDEISCVEYLCDLLCFHLDLASFVACVNSESGRRWNSKDSILLSRNKEMTDQSTSSNLDPFVENFVLERLSIQTPLRVLFDLVPGIKFQEAIEIISLQPIVSTTAAWKRQQDIELVHLRYALESAILALGSMGGCISEDSDRLYSHALRYLKDMQNYMEAVNNIPRKVFLLSIIVSLLYMDQVPIASAHFDSSSFCATVGQQDHGYSSSSNNNAVVSFLELLVDIVHHSLPDVGSELDNCSKSDSVVNAKQAVEWRISKIKHFVEDWKWRLSVLQRLLPVSARPWSWTEALALLRAAPSHLLNLCMQRAKYDIGEEAVHRFSLSAEDKAVLELTEWVAGVSRKASVEDSVSRIAEKVSATVLDLDFSLLRSQLGSIVAILLCIDVAATSARSIDVCMLLLNQARNILSDIYPGGSPRVGPDYWDQIKDVTMISVIRRVLQRLLDLLEDEKVLTLKEFFAGDTFISPVNQLSKQGQSRALTVLHQMIDDAHQGKRQFLSGKLHNLARVAAEEDTDDSSLKGNGNYKTSPGGEKGAVIGLGLKSQRSSHVISASTENGVQYINHDVKEPGRRLLSHFTSKPTYLSAFIIYIATIGDIVDGIDTTHDFNFFSLVYEWPKDVLTRLVFERGSIDAAGKVADIMCADLVHEVISACVPPVFPPRSGHGWASIPLLPSYFKTSENRVSLHSFNVSGAASNSLFGTAEAPFYPLELNIVKHLAKLSPVRAILACVFGSTILSSNSGSSISPSVSAAADQESDTERLFYEFALDQSERFPTLDRWIQMQSNLHRVSESAIAASRNADTYPVPCLSKISVKRSRESESDTESDVDDIILGTQAHATSELMQRSPVSPNFNIDSAAFLSLDWENEEPYEKVVERLICEVKLMDALALSDRFLRGGASDNLLQLLIEHGEEKNSLISGQPPGYGSLSYSSRSWQYCLRLKDKHLAAKLALKYLQRWDLNASIDVLTMCSCHLPPSDPLRNEVLQRRKDLQKYDHILCADDKHKSWQEVESECKEDPEGLALRLAGKGAVSAALKVAESAYLSIDLRRELQGRQLVKLLTTDPLSGGGPAEASRFLSSLHDPDDVLPVAIGAMKLLSDLRSKQLLVHFFLKRKAGNLSDVELARLNSWALGLRVLSVLPLPWQQRCSALHEHPHLILEVLLMMKQLQYASLILKEFPSLRDDSLILMYSKKAIAMSPSFTLREPRISVSVSRTRQQSKAGLLSRTNFTNSLNNLQKEARRAFSWAPRDVGSKVTTSETHRKRKSSGFTPSEAIPGIQEEHGYMYSIEGQERSPNLSVTEWVLVGDPSKDDAIRSSHRYETSPDIVLFKGLLSLCSDDLVSVKGALDQSVTLMKSVLSSPQLQLNASTEAIGHAYHATEIFVQAFAFAKTELRKLIGNSDWPTSSERIRDMDDASADTSSSSVSSQYPDELSELQAEADIWFGRAELLQSLLGSGIVASLDDIADKESATRLRDRLIKDEQYSMAVYTCKKCKIDAFPVWNAWGHALIRMEQYAQARIKFKQALQLHKDNPSSVMKDIINTLEGGPPVDVSAVLSMYEHLAKSASTIMDDSLSADSYLNVLNMPSTFPRSEKSRRYHDSANNRSASSGSAFEDGPHSNLDNIRYLECIYYLQEYDRPRMIGFMFKHGHYADACALFFPLNTMPSTFQLTAPGTISTASSPQRFDSLTTDYGSIEDLCDLCIGYGAMDVLENFLATRKASVAEDASLSQHIVIALIRICNFCETHRHFNYLYKFIVIKQDHVAAGLCCIQLFMNSSSQEEAVKHLEYAKMHFEEGLSAKEGEATKLLSKPVRGKLASGKLSEEGLIKFTACIAIQVNVLKNFTDTEGLPWKHSLFGNPSDPETFRRRCEIAEKLAEKNFDLAFQVIYQFNLPAVDIYAAVAASLAERKKSGQLTEFFKNVKGTVGADDWDQVLGAAINVYANRHKERPDRLIDMLISSHRKVLACVVCGRLKSAFQIASRSGSVADVQYVAHQALHANALPVLDMCKQWLAQYM